MADTGKRLKLVSEAATELIEYIEKLAETTWIDVDPSHGAVRVDLHAFDGPGSGWGDRIPFSLYKRVVDKVQKDNSKLQKKKTSKVDSVNAQFETEVNELVEAGSSFPDAMELVSGVGNLAMLADGMVEGVLGMLENILPSELVIPDALFETISLVRTYMSEGMNNVPPEVNNFLDKMAPGWKQARNKKGKTAHMGIMNYAYSYAVKSSGSNAARLWEMWAMYPTLKGIKQTADLHSVSVPPETQAFTSNSSGSYLDSQMDDWDQYLRRGAVLLSNTFAQSALCCITGLLAALETAREFVATLKKMMTVIAAFNINIMESVSLDIGRYAVAAQNAIIGALTSSINENFKKQVAQLRKLWLDLVEKSGLMDCIPLVQLFDGLVGILVDMKNKMVLKLRGLLQWADSNWSIEATIQLGMMEQYSFSLYLDILNTVERLLDLEIKCPVDGSANDRRAVDIIKKLRFDGEGFKGHIKGTPLPEGMDPDYPLANLEPVITGHNVTLEPGIQGSDLPNEELEELFSRCRQGNFNDEGILKTVPGIFRRR